MKLFMNLLRLFVFVFCLVSFSGCGIKRIVTKTITTIQIDTIIQVRVDTFLIHDTLGIDSFLAGDTLKTENTVAEARTYFDKQLNTVVIDLKGKVFDLPVTIQATQMTKTRETTMPKMKWYAFYIFGFMTCIFLWALTKLKQ